MPPPTLPIDPSLPDIVAALGDAGRVVIEAPPGAGKTTRVPLALMQAGFDGRIVMLEPRRIAARAAAERMAATLGEAVGERIGYRIRGEAKVSNATRIEVVTEGILTRMLQSDPELPGVGTILFDEFHERSLNADLGLALAWEVRESLRPDLRLGVMSATLDAAPVAAMLEDAPIVTAAGRAFPVETRWLAQPLRPQDRWDSALADLVLTALADDPGGALVFLPGAAEIHRLSRLIAPRLGADVTLCPLYGALSFAEQRKAIAPLRSGRKLVLATAIAETSLTLEDIRIVVDGGRARRLRHDPATGMSRLVTEPVSRAEAAQRQGRAGRVAPGVCYRLWAKGQEGALPEYPPPEIATADLAGLALDLAAWGTAQGLKFLTPPPEGSLAQARALLEDLGALDTRGAITAAGRALAEIPLHPRLAHMVRGGGPGAARLAALLAERDPLPGRGADLSLRMRAVDDPAAMGADRDTAARIRQEAKRLRRFEGGPPQTLAQQAARAYPDRIGLRRAGSSPRYVLSGGKGGVLAEDDALVNTRLLVATDLDGDRREARIRQAVALSEAELRALFSDRIAWHEVCFWSKRTRRVEARKQERLGALVLQDQIWKSPPDDALLTGIIEGFQSLGVECLNWTKRAKLLRARVGFAGIRDVSDAALLAEAEAWLGPYLTGVRDAEGLRRFDPHDALRAWIGWAQMGTLDALAPERWQSPMGRALAIDYSGAEPEVSVRLQEVLGTTTHPTVGHDRRPIKVTLLSPAQRPIQVTTDLPGFWAGSYADVRKDMRSQYPKHDWPEDPAEATPTLRAKPRKK